MEGSTCEMIYQKPKDLAGLGRRLGGQMIDSVVTYLVFLFSEKVFGYLGYLLQVPENVPGSLAAALAVGYYLFSDALPNGQSVGKKLLGMRVIDELSSISCTMLQSFVRNITTPFLSILDWIFIFFGSRKRLGDMIANTIVIRSK